jgi:membrane-associated phospholipid phosphatase
VFQTELILFLQSFESDLLNVFFETVNSAGYSQFFMSVPIIIMFGIHFRKGFYLLHILLWTGFATNFLKEYFALPRPSDVDSNVRYINTGYPNPTKFDSMGARSFLGRLPDEVVTYFRSIEGMSYGLPSGHVSAATALWGGMYQLFQQQWVRVLSIALIALMPITRMYLGRHFLADVLGGIIVGMFFVLFFHFSVYRSHAIRDTFGQRVAYFPLDPKTVLQWVYFVILPFMVYWVTSQGKGPGLLLGLNAGFIVVAMRGLPTDEGSFFHRLLRTLIAAVSFHGPNLLLKNLGLYDIPSLEYIRYAVAGFVMMCVTTELSVKLGLYKRGGTRTAHSLC